jgi:hypothetical protein
MHHQRYSPDQAAWHRRNGQAPEHHSHGSGALRPSIALEWRFLPEEVGGWGSACSWVSLKARTSQQAGLAEHWIRLPHKPRSPSAGPPPEASPGPLALIASHPLSSAFQAVSARPQRKPRITSRNPRPWFWLTVGWCWNHPEMFMRPVVARFVPSLTGCCLLAAFAPMTISASLRTAWHGWA